MFFLCQTDPSPTTLFQPSLATTDWSTQHPLGSGRFGALVGGNIRAQIVPVSVAGFYVRKALMDGEFLCLCFRLLVLALCMH